VEESATPKAFSAQNPLKQKLLLFLVALRRRRRRSFERVVTGSFVFHLPPPLPPPLLKPFLFLFISSPSSSTAAKPRASFYPFFFIIKSTES